MTADQEHIVFEQIQFAAITRNGFSDVSILTAGEADGHGVMIDEGTIDGFMRLALGKTLPAYLTHEGAQDPSTGDPKDRLGKEIGMFSGFYRDGNKIRAKNFQFLDSFIASEPKAHATLVEIAQKFADKLGISPVMLNLRKWVLGNGEEEVMSGNGKPASAKNKFPSMRVKDVLSCDFVQRPAANLGLFSAIVDDSTSNNPPNMTAETILLSKHTEALTAKDGEITALQTQHKDAVTALETKHATALTLLQTQVNDLNGKLAQATTKETALVASLAAKTTEAEESGKYDMRKAGAPALEIALQAHTQKLPAPGTNDQENWEKYTSLCTLSKDNAGNVTGSVETPAAKAFKIKYLSRK